MCDNPEEIPSLGSAETSAGGFPIIRFLDFYDRPCAIRQSSIAHNPVPGTSALEFKMSQPFMVLDYGQVCALHAHLSRWIEHGVIDLNDEPNPAAWRNDP